MNLERALQASSDNFKVARERWAETMYIQKIGEHHMLIDETKPKEAQQTRYEPDAADRFAQDFIVRDKVEVATGEPFDKDTQEANQLKETIEPIVPINEKENLNPNLRNLDSNLQKLDTVGLTKEEGKTINGKTEALHAKDNDDLKDTPALENKEEENTGKLKGGLDAPQLPLIDTVTSKENMDAPIAEEKKIPEALVDNADQKKEAVSKETVANNKSTTPALKQDTAQKSKPAAGNAKAADNKEAKAPEKKA